jgi:hypothetical protein
LAFISADFASMDSINGRLRILWEKIASVLNRYRLLSFSFFARQPSVATIYIILGIVGHLGMTKYMGECA